MSKDNLGSNLVFFLLGAATGAAIALLYAPQEGEATRRFLADKTGEVKDKAAEQANTIATQAKQTYTNVAQQAKDTYSNVAAQAKAKADQLAGNRNCLARGSSRPMRRLTRQRIVRTPQ